MNKKFLLKFYYLLKKRNFDTDALKIYNWYKYLKYGRGALENEECAARRSTGTVNENANGRNGVIHSNRQLNTEDLFDVVGTINWKN